MEPDNTGVNGLSPLLQLSFLRDGYSNVVLTSVVSAAEKVLG